MDGTESRRYMGPLPVTGQWVRLEVAASQVGLEGRTLGGMALTLHGGRATWDRAGKAGAAAGGGASNIEWLVTDQLGTPRMVVDETGSLAGVKRHDYLPFGEEVGAGVGGRTASQGYSQLAGVRQGFTGYEKDGETGLDFAQARHYANSQGRFTSIDPVILFDNFTEPQSWNRYTYCINNPLKYTDPTGLIWLQNGDSFRYVNDSEYKPEEWEGWTTVLDGAIFQITGVGGSYSKYGDLVGGYASFNKDGTLTAVADPTELVIGVDDMHYGYQVGFGPFSMGESHDTSGNSASSIGLSASVPLVNVQPTYGDGPVPTTPTLSWNAGLCFVGNPNCFSLGNELYTNEQWQDPFGGPLEADLSYGLPGGSIGITLTFPVLPPPDPYSQMQRKRWHPGYAPHP